MFGPLRIAFAFLLTAALSLQGFAAGSMTVCGIPGEGGSATHRVLFERFEPASMMAATPVHDHFHGDARHHQDAGHSKVIPKCNVCASCCASMAMVVSDLTFDSVALPESFTPCIPTEIPAFLTEGLERPPRTSFT